MFPIAPEGIHGSRRFRRKGEFTRGNQCVVRMLDATPYISMNSNHYFQSRERVSSIPGLRCIRRFTVGLLVLTRVDELLPDQVCRVTTTPQRVHSTFSIPLPAPNWKVFSSTRKSWKPNRQRRLPKLDLNVDMVLVS